MKKQLKAVVFLALFTNAFSLLASEEKSKQPKTIEALQAEIKENDKQIELNGKIFFFLTESMDIVRKTDYDRKHLKKLRKFLKKTINNTIRLDEESSNLDTQMSNLLSSQSKEESK